MGPFSKSRITLELLRDPFSPERRLPDHSPHYHSIAEPSLVSLPDWNYKPNHQDGGREENEPGQISDTTWLQSDELQMSLTLGTKQG